MTEINQSHALIVGGFSPVHTGHKWNFDQAAAGGHTSVNIFTTQSARRPISAEKKVEYIKKVVGPDVNVDTTLTPLHAASQLYSSGKRGKLVVYGGSDRSEIADRIRDYNNKESKHGFYNFDSIEFRQVGGERKEGAKGVAGFSGSAARKSKNPTELKKFLPKELHADAEDIFKQINEETVMPLAIFLLGGPGSGKDYVLTHIFSRFDLTEVQGDHILNGAAGELIHENKNIVINGVSDLDKIQVINALLEEYNIDYVYVSVTNKVSRLRNSLREQPLAETKRTEKWLRAEQLAEKLDGFSFNNSINLNESSELEKVFFANQIEKLLERLVNHGLEIKEEPKQQAFTLIREKKFPAVRKKYGMPAKYSAGLSKSTALARKRHWAKANKLSDSDPNAYKPAPGDATAKTKPSKHTLAVRKMMASEGVISTLASMVVKKEVKDLPKTLEVARLTAQRRGQIEKTIDKTVKTATVPVGVAGLTSDEAETNKNKKPAVDKTKMQESADKSLAAKAAKSGISLSTLRKVYRRGVAAWNSGHRPGTTPSQWGHARVNSYINKGKTYHTADKDLREAAAKYGEKGTGENKGKFWTGSSWKKPSEMSDEERYGKTGAAIRKLDPEAYKERDKTAAGNKELLKKLQSAPAPEPKEEPAAPTAEPAPSGDTSGTRRTPTPMTPDEIAELDAIRQNQELMRRFKYRDKDQQELDRLTYEYEQELKREAEQEIEIEVKKPFSTKREIIKVPRGPRLPEPRWRPNPPLRNPNIPRSPKVVAAQFELQSDLNQLFEMQLVGTDEYRKHAIAMTPGQNQEIEDVTKTMGMDVSSKGKDCDCPDESDCGCDEPLREGSGKSFRTIRAEAKETKEEPTADVTPTLKKTKGSNRVSVPGRLVNPAADGLPVTSRMTGESVDIQEGNVVRPPRWNKDQEDPNKRAIDDADRKRSAEKVKQQQKDAEKTARTADQIKQDNTPFGEKVKEKIKNTTDTLKTTGKNVARVGLRAAGTALNVAAVPGVYNFAKNTAKEVGETNPVAPQPGEYPSVMTALHHTQTGKKVKDFMKRWGKSYDAPDPLGAAIDKAFEEVNPEKLDEAIQYHLTENISFTENVFRPGSQMFFEMLKEAKRLYKEGKYEPKDEYEKDLLESDVGEFASYEGTMIPLDFPFEDESLQEEDKTNGKGIGKPWRENGGGAVYVRDGGSIRKIRFSQSGMKKKYMDPGATRSFVARHHCLTNKDKTSASYWACRWPRYFSNSGKVWW